MPEVFGVLVLAAGKGTRMKSDLPKVLHPVREVPMLGWVLDTADSLGPAWTVTVIGAGAERVQERFRERSRFVLQEPQLGSGHAVMQAVPLLEGEAGDVLVLMGDVPLLRRQTLEALLSEHRASGAACTVLTAVLPEPGAYGRVIRDDYGNVRAIREARDANEAERGVREINTGIYAFDVTPLCRHIRQLKADNAQGEYYLTDLVEIFHAVGLKVRAFKAGDHREVAGINHRGDLADAERELGRRINREWMLTGVTMLDPDRTDIGPAVRLEPEVVLHPGITLRGTTTVARGCEILPGSWLENAVLEADVRVEFSVVRDSVIRARTTVGPFAHIRGGAVIGASNRIGNFVEIKKTTTGTGTKASHLSYLGDATVGAEVNVGAGTITCNYDGVRKNPTVIEDGAFIGSDSILVAPVTVGRGAYTAAGSTVTQDVPADALAVARARQTTVEGWALRRRRKLAGEKVPEREKA